MTRARLVKTSFTAGELDPRLLGRLDLKAQEDGASRLRNVIVHPTGGVTRRPGTAYAATVPGGLRLIPFDGADGGEILVFGAWRIDIVKAGAIVIRPSRPTYSLDKLVSRITPTNRHGESDWGGPQGGEAW